jgi:hypothetical protein
MQAKEFLVGLAAFAPKHVYFIVLPDTGMQNSEQK